MRMFLLLFLLEMLQKYKLLPLVIILTLLLKPVSYTHLIRIVVAVDGFLAECFGTIFQGGRLAAAEKDLRIHIADNGVGVVPVSYTHLDVYKRQVR